MLRSSDDGNGGPLLVSILRQGAYLIVSIHTALDDGQLLRLQRDLIEEVGRQRSRGIVLDVAALDVLDSFGAHTLRTIAHVAKLRGAETVIVGINPEVALAMTRLGMNLDTVHTALDLEEGLVVLNELTGTRGRRQAEQGALARNLTVGPA